MFVPALPWSTLIAANLIMALASMLQASVGIGLALLAVPLLVLINPHFVPGPLLLAGSVLACASAYRERQALDPSSLGLAVLGLALGTVVGAGALRALSSAPLSKVFALLILCAVALSLAGWRIPPSRAALFTGGSAAGVMGTMVGIHGPPIALVVQYAPPAQARAMLGAFFCVAYIGSVAALAMFGLFGAFHLQLAMLLLPGVVTGLSVAPLLTGYLHPRRLRLAILLISASSAVVLLLR
ncbi:MAG: TSUP family transporter [Candidatus Tectimicrobiota bacterium]